MQNSKIQWCDHTFNPWEGCTKVSPGCAHCYAEARNHRFGLDNWGKGKPRRLTSEANWKQPLKWNRTPKICNACGFAHQPSVEQCKIYVPDYHGERHCDSTSFHRARVFCASLADWLDAEVPIKWLARLLKLIHDTPNLDWLLLTKRPENWRPRIKRIAQERDPNWKTSTRFPEVSSFAHAWLLGQSIPRNVWIMASTEDQERLNERLSHLLEIPAVVHGLSVEPMLGPVSIDDAAYRIADQNHAMPHWGHREMYWPDWVIFGGESGPGARPCNIDWIRDGVKQCRAAGVAPFVKQLGANPIMEPGPLTWPCEDKKGGDWSEWPEDLRIREFPL